MATYSVKEIDGSHYIVGLTPEFADHDEKDTILIYHYPGGDIDTRMKNADMMLGALYDTFQCQDGLHDSDRFETEFGAFVCIGVHVVPA